MKEITILNSFSEFPGLRNCSISDNSGEEFYHKVLNKEFTSAYNTGEKLKIDLDRTAGYASSFLDEAFGNLVFDFTLSIVEKNIEVVSNQEPHWKEMIENKTFPQWEKRRKEKENPKVTKEHEAWYRLIDNKLQLNVWEHPGV